MFGLGREGKFRGFRDFRRIDLAKKSPIISILNKFMIKFASRGKTEIIIETFYVLLVMFILCDTNKTTKFVVRYCNIFSSFS